MRMLLLVSLLWQLSHLCSAQQCYSSSATCLAKYQPDGCEPTNVHPDCRGGARTLWKTGINQGTSTGDASIDRLFVKCQNFYTECGYVKVEKRSIGCKLEDESSGVIIGSIDLGKETEASLRAAGVLDSVITKLTPYLEKTGDAAREAICTTPGPLNSPNIADWEVGHLSSLVIQDSANDVQTWYDGKRTTDALAFTALPKGIRTIMASFNLRMGREVGAITEPFWDAILSNDFDNAVYELRNMYDCGVTDERLQSEANVIEASLGCTSSSGIDCVFLIDESGSVSSSNFQLAINWVEDFVETFESSISSGSSLAARFGLATFDTGYKDHFLLDEYSDITDYRTAIQAAAPLYSGGLTYLGTALGNIKTNQFDPKARNSVSRALIVMTDGLANGPTPIGTPATDLLADGVIIIAVGIDGYDINQLQEITNYNDDRIYVLNTFSDLFSILDGITSQTCTVQTVLNLASSGNVEDKTLLVNQIDVYEIDASSAATSGQNIVLSITQTIGCVYVYVSHCNDKPNNGAGNHDVSFTSCNQIFKRIVVGPSASSCASTKLYVGIEARATGTSCLRRRLQSDFVTFDFAVSTCNLGDVGCENGTNYDPDLDIDPPYYIDETTVAPTTTSQSIAPATTLNGYGSTTNNPSDGNSPGATSNAPGTTSNSNNPSDINGIPNDGDLDEADAGTAETIPAETVYAGVGIVFLIAICCVCCICYICCKQCGAKKSSEKEKKMNTVVHVVQVPAATNQTNGYPGNYPPNTNVNV